MGNFSRAPSWQRQVRTKKPCSVRARLRSISLFDRSQSLYCFGLRALRPLNHLKLHGLALLKRSVSFFLYRRVMNEDVGATRLLYEPVALCVAEPLDLALRR